MQVVPRTHGPWRLIAAAALCLVALPARSQENPVFVDDSTLASDVLAGLPGLSAAGNQGEAVRLLQRLLDEEGDRLIEAPDDPALYQSVRSRVHNVLTDDQTLLARYREAESARAGAMLEAGRHDDVERTRLLTRPGFEAALRVAAAHLGAARFESARLVLRQIEHHPDRADQALARDAAALAARLAAYLEREEVVQAAARWAEWAGSAPGPSADPVAWPRPLREPVHSPDAAGDAVDLGALVGTPLRTVNLQPSPAMSAAPEEEELPSRRPRTMLEFPYIFPLVVDDTVYTTDGLWISAWDRFTLTPRWQTKPRGADNEREALEEQYAARAYRKRQSRDIEEATTLAAHGRLLLAATGLVSEGGRTGDPRLHALDRTTGRVLWSSYIDELDEQLADASTRGPAVFEGDTAVVAVRKIPMAKRFASAYLVGIDLADGSARWVRLAGSAGWLAYGGRGQWSDWPTLHEGVVYRVDELGVICAIEAGTGRYRWVRRLPGVESRLPTQRVPWAASRPVIDGRTMLALSPDRSQLLRIDLDTGAILGMRDARQLGSPSYVFGAGDRLVAVSQLRVATVPLARAETGPANVSPLIPEPGIVGRVALAGDSLLLPLVSGVGVVSLANLADGREVTLDASGNLVPLDNQLLAADNAQIHSYLVWDRAAEILEARLHADPLDVSTAVTFAELAYRAGRPEAVLDPVDRALAAMGADPLRPVVRTGQRRLFQLLLEMLQGGDRPENAPAIGAGLVAPLAERLGMVAVTPDERATHLLVLAGVHLGAGAARDAVADCQRVIADPTMAGASWQHEGSTVRAELEAISRLDDALRAYGIDAYAPFEASARDALESLRRREAKASDFEAAARAYPRAVAGIEAWLEAARLREATGMALGADHALGRALDAVRALQAVGASLEPALVGEVVGRRIDSLVAHGRVDAAAGELRRADLDWPDLALAVEGRPLDRAELSATLRRRLEARETRPRIEPPLGGAAAALDGWALMRALDRRDAFARRDGVMLLGGGEVGLWEARAGALAPRWTSPYERKPSLVSHGSDRVLLFEPDDLGGALIALAPADGALLWRTEPLGGALAAAEGAGPAAGPERFDSPLDGPVSARDLVLALDETVIAVVSRSGRVAGFDAATGRALWAKRSACHAVHDASAGEGVLLLGGASTPASGDEAGEPIVVMLDLSTGEEISRFTGAVGQVRWVKLIPGAQRAVAGLSQGLVGLSVPHAQADWVLADPVLEETSAAWIAGDRLLVQTSLLDLASLEPRSGRLLASRLEFARRLDLTSPMDVVAADGRVVVLSPDGCAILDAAGGGMVGADAVEHPPGGVVQPALASETVVIVERDPAPGSSDLYRCHVIDGATGRSLESALIRFDAPPNRLALLDDIVIVTAGDRTIALPAGRP